MDYNYGEYTQGYIDEGCSVVVSQEVQYNTDKEVSYETYRAVLKNLKNKELESSYSSKSLEKAVLALEKRAEKRRKKELEKRRPFAELTFKVNNITDLMFSNNDKAKRLSRNETYGGWDINYYGSEGKAIIKIHNSANYVIGFDMFEKQDMRRIEVNLHCLRFSEWAYRSDMEALPYLLKAIDEYLDVPLTDRKAEFDKE